MNIEGFDSGLMSKGRERHMEGEKKGDGWMWVGINRLSKGRERHMYGSAFNARVREGRDTWKKGRKKMDGCEWVLADCGLVWIGYGSAINAHVRVNKLDHHLRPYHLPPAPQPSPPSPPFSASPPLPLATAHYLHHRPPVISRLYPVLSRVPNRSWPEYIWPRPGYPDPHALSSQDPAISGLDPAISGLDPAILALWPTRLFRPRPDNISLGRGQDRQYPTKSLYIWPRLGPAMSDKDLAIPAAKTSGLDLTIFD
nr:hypothetical protein [Tanacetum cinerariifolium]